MPIEIKELIIKVNVEAETQAIKERKIQPIDKEEIIEECIDRIIAEIEYRLGD